MRLVDRPRARRYCRLASWIACHTRAGVAGMSRCVTPSGASASSTALIAAQGAATVPASPAPLTPSAFVRVGVSSSHVSISGEIFRPRQAVVHQRSAEELARAALIDAMLEQRLAEPLRDRAHGLAVHDHRVHSAADVVDRDIAHQNRLPGLRVDLDLAYMAAVRPRDMVVAMQFLGRERLLLPRVHRGRRCDRCRQRRNARAE